MLMDQIVHMCGWRIERDRQGTRESLENAIVATVSG